MRTRELFLSFAAAMGLTLAACGVSVTEGERRSAEDAASTPTVEGWTLAVLGGDEGPRRYLVIRPDGVQAAAEAADGAARIIDAGEAHAAMSEGLNRQVGAEGDGEQVRIKMPFVDVDVVDGGSGETANVSVNAGGTQVQVNSAGDGSTAVVRIAGVDAEEAREFIEKAEGLTPEVKQAMREALGL